MTGRSEEVQLQLFTLGYSPFAEGSVLLGQLIVFKKRCLPKPEKI